MSARNVIKKGDTVLITKGKDRGKKGKVLDVLVARGVLLVDGVNEKVRHVRPKQSRQKGQKVTVNHPVKRDNVMLVCPNCSKGTRVSFTTSESGKKSRICKKCGKNMV